MDLSYTDPDSGETGKPTHWAPKYRRCAHPDPGHGWGAGRDQLRNGFLAGNNDEYALAYYLAEDIPTFAQLARQFTVFDNYFCAVLGPTYPNRWYQHAATSMGLKSNMFPPRSGQPDRVRMADYLGPARGRGRGLALLLRGPSFHRDVGAASGPPHPADR